MAELDARRLWRGTAKLTGRTLTTVQNKEFEIIEARNDSIQLTIGENKREISYSRELIAKFCQHKEDGGEITPESLREAKVHFSKKRGYSYLPIIVEELLAEYYLDRQIAKKSYVVIAENDESLWEDVTGETYHFPKRYKKYLIPGQEIIYYKGGIKRMKYSQNRLSDQPHYFGTAKIGEVAEDPNSKKGDLFCAITDYVQFKKAVPIKLNGKYLEQISKSQMANYWRVGVRKIDGEVYSKILSLAVKGIKSKKKKRIELPAPSGDFESYQKEGEKRIRYTTYYERKPFNRMRAIEFHGLSCKACKMNFEKRYGELGRGFIHVHHIKPVSEHGGEVFIDPKKDLTVLCPNCHAMVHKPKEQTLSIIDLKKLIR